MKKRILSFLLLLITFYCQADQLELLTKEQAIKATDLLRKQSEIISWCACCNLEDGGKKETIQISKVYIKKVDLNSNQLENYFVVIEGKNADNNENFNRNVDLAYIHINKNGNWFCVGKELGFECDPCTKSFFWTDLNYDNVVENNSDNIDVISSHFSSFVNASSDEELLEIYKQHKPTINDCKVMFKKDFYKTAYQNINYMYNSFDSQKKGLNSGFNDKNYCRVNTFTTNDVINNSCEICPGKVKKLASKLNPNITCYIVKFLENEDSEHGITSTFFVEINGRWVYFP